MKRRDFTLGALGLAGLAGAGFASTARAAATDEAEALITAALAATEAPALAAAVIDREGVVWKPVRGRRRADAPDPVTPNDQWHLGSNTKAMTAALWARLVEQGKVAWGAKVGDLFPGVRIDAAWADTPIEAVMQHRAGISDKGLLDPVWLTVSRTDPRPLTEQRRAVAARVFGAPPAGTPGTYQYANADYIILGSALEQATGQPWEDLIRAELFDPLRMGSAGFGAPKGAQPWGHAPGGKPIDPEGIADNPPALGPAGTVHCNLEDYGRFLRVFLTDGGGWISPDSVTRLTTPPDTAADQSYACGWLTYRQRGWAQGPVLAHEGSNTLWRMVAAVAPKRGLAIMTATNDDPRGAKAAQALTLKLVQLFAPV